jgi:hypothetical protein
VMGRHKLGKRKGRRPIGTELKIIPQSCSLSLEFKIEKSESISVNQSQDFLKLYSHAAVSPMSGCRI